jgi:predicted aspartyl protease
MSWWSWMKSRAGFGQAGAISFNFETINTFYLGEIRRPVAKVKFWSEEFQEWQEHTMLIDTGADYSVLPMYMVGLLGLDLSDAKVVRTRGIEGTRKTSFIEGVKVRIGDHERVIPVGIAHTSRIPPLMGRHMFFETFQTKFAGSKTVTFEV